MLLRLLVESGRKAEAIKHYESLLALLRKDFATEPADHISRLMSPLVMPKAELAAAETAAAAIGQPAIAYGSSIERALETYLKLGDAERAMRLAATLLAFWSLQGEVSVARRWLKRALAVPQAIDAPPDARAAALMALGISSSFLGNFDEGRGALSAALALGRGTGNQQLIGDSLRFLGSLSARQGNHREAQSQLLRSVEIFRLLGDKNRLAESLTILGEALRHQNDLESSESANREARKLRFEIGRPDRAAGSALNLGILASRRGDFPSALAMLRESLGQVRGLGSPTVVADCLMEIGGICAQTGDPSRAAQLLGAAARLREAVKAPMDSTDRVDYVRFLNLARRSLGKTRFIADWEAGRNQKLDAAIDLALEFERLREL